MSSDRYDPVVVVIATSNKRTDLLLERSLRSVYEQKDVNPIDIYIIDDNDKQKDSKQKDKTGIFNEVPSPLRNDESNEYKTIRTRTKNTTTERQGSKELNISL